MVLHALGDPSGGSDLSLKDGRPLHMVKLVVAVRSSEERSTNVFIDVEDGTGLTQVKVWVNEGDECSAISQLRSAAGREHTYIRVIGQVRDFDGQRQIVANDIRPVSSGNELTHHLLEVAYSYEKYRKMQSDTSLSGGMGMGIGIGNMASMVPLQGGGGMGMGAHYGYSGGGGGGGVDEAVVQVIKTLGCEYRNSLWISCFARMPFISNFHSHINILVLYPVYFLANEGSGIHVNAIISQLTSKGYSAGEIKESINTLSNEGLIYSTIDENHFQYAE